MPTPAQPSFARELWDFMRVRKKWWLGPIVLVLVLFGALIVLTQGSAVAPVHLHDLLMPAGAAARTAAELRRFGLTVGGAFLLLALVSGGAATRPAARHGTGSGCCSCCRHCWRRALLGAGRAGLDALRRGARTHQHAHHPHRALLTWCITPVGLVRRWRSAIRSTAARATAVPRRGCAARGRRSTRRATASSSDGPTILGISAYYHDSAACLVRDGEIVAAAQEERFTRKRHDADFPAQRGRVLPRGGRHRRSSDVDYVGFYDKPLLKFERLLEQYLGVAPRGLRPVPGRHAGVAEGEAVHPLDDPPRARRLRGRGAVHRAPRVARRQRVLSVAVRGGGGAHDGRGRRVGDVVVGRRARERARAAGRAALPALARHAVLGVHLLHRLQGELRRVQGDGAGAVRRAALRRSRSSTALVELRDDGSFKLNMRYFDFLHGLHHDERAPSTSCSTGRRARPSRRSRSGRWTWRRRSRW